MNLVQETGFRKPVCMLKVADKASLRSVLVDYHCMMKVKSAMDQFAEGMQTLQFLDFVKQYPQQMQPLFVSSGSTEITSGMYCVYNVQH